MDKVGTIAGGIMFLVGLGLILRFGGSSNALAGTTFTGVNSWLNTLSLQGFKGNNPPGVY